MGNRSSTAIIFVLLVTFLGTFALLVNAIPPEFFTPETLRETSTRTDWFPSENIGYYNYSDSCNLTKPGHEELQIGDIWVDVWWFPVGTISFEHIWPLWWIFVDSHEFDNMPLTLEDVESHSPHEGYANRSYMIQTCPCPKTYHTYFIYNSTTYSSWSEAWSAGDLDVFVGMGWDDAIEKMNAWSLIWSILIFQAPEVFGGGVGGILLNAIIAVPLWASFAIVGAIMTLWFIPFLGGE